MVITVSGRARSPRKDGRLKLDLRHLAFAGLHACLGLATSLLISWGLFVFAILAIGGFSLEGVMHHLANLSTRYESADAGRTSSFNGMLLTAQAIFFGAIVLLRRKSLMPRDGGADA